MLEWGCLLYVNFLTALSTPDYNLSDVNISTTTQCDFMKFCVRQEINNAVHGTILFYMTSGCARISLVWIGSVKTIWGETLTVLEILPEICSNACLVLQVEGPDIVKWFRHQAGWASGVCSQKE
jgi:hypothetical protein